MSKFDWNENLISAIKLLSDLQNWHIKKNSISEMTAPRRIRKRGAAAFGKVARLTSDPWAGKKLSGKGTEGLIDGCLAHFGNRLGNRRTRGFNERINLEDKNHRNQQKTWIYVQFT